MYWSKGALNLDKKISEDETTLMVKGVVLVKRGIKLRQKKSVKMNLLYNGEGGCIGQNGH